jgi:hypothetical protein
MKTMLNQYSKTTALTACLALMLGMPLTSLAGGPTADTGQQKQEETMGLDAEALKLDPQTRATLAATRAEAQSEQQAETEYVPLLAKAVDPDMEREL